MPQKYPCSVCSKKCRNNCVFCGVLVPLTKRPKTEEYGSSPCIKTQELSKLVARAKQRLQNFVATNLDNVPAQDVTSIDYSIRNRENTSKVPDIGIYSQDEMQTVTTVEGSQDNFIPHPSTSVPHPPTSVPHPSTNIPHPSTNIPHTSTNILHPSTNIPHMSTSFEKPTIDLQHPQTAISKVSKFSAYEADQQVETGKKTVRTKASVGSLVKYTPLEQQFIELKDKWKDAVLFVECGYKYRFFGEDAEIASRVLKIYAHRDHNFMTASIPVHRLFVHLRRIVSAGYKVGVIQQTETAALKAAGSNKHAPFTRQLTALYTKATMIGEDMDMDTEPNDSIAPVAMTTSYLMCVCEQEAPKGSPGTLIGIVAVQPSTGDIIYDSFVDTGSRPELETRLSHIQPVEVIIPSNVSTETEKLLTGLQTISYHGDDRMRIERLEHSVFLFSEAFARVSQLYQHEATCTVSDSSGLQTVINLPQPVICCLAALIEYLQDFKLDKILREVGNFSQFSTKSTYMQLNSCTVRNLEIFHNVTNRGERGSLYWVINQTVTPAGARLLRMWLSRPLLSHSYITMRQEAVSNILDGKFPDIQKLKVALSRLPDVERRLASVYHKKCSPSDFCNMCQAFITIHDKFQHQKEAASCHVTSKLLLEIISEIPELLSDVGNIVDKIDCTAARENDKTNMFSDNAGFPRILDCKEKITLVTEEIQVHRRYVRLTIRQPTLQYCSILGTEFLVEVKNSSISLVPKDWTKISSTKVVSRFHTPFIVAKYKELQQYREHLVIESNKAWTQFLDSFSERYQRYRKAIHHMSTMDCLCSLATVAQQHAYIRPEIVEDEVCIDIEGGRHPVIQELLGEDKQYVANDTHISTSGKHVMLISGPNMGGKSCYIRQVALVSILAQIGSFVPARAARLGIVDSIFTRMGGSDDIYGGRSTFMVELQEAADGMAKATSRSLVILDELGRGTSTHDGVAIAHATLDFFIRQKCLTLFVTHYQSLAEFEMVYPDNVGNYHMSFLLGDDDTDSDEIEQITFLYELVPGVAARSYGLNVARLANIPEHIVKMAAIKSKEMESNELSHRSRCEVFKKLCATSRDISYKELIEQLI